jgi:hypothetical protein
MNDTTKNEENEDEIEAIYIFGPESKLNELFGDVHALKDALLQAVTPK